MKIFIFDSDAGYMAVQTIVVLANSKEEAIELVKSKSKGNLDHNDFQSCEEHEMDEPFVYCNYVF